MATCAGPARTTYGERRPRLRPPRQPRGGPGPPGGVDAGPTSEQPRGSQREGGRFTGSAVRRGRSDARPKELLARGFKPAVTAETCARLVALPRPRAPESRKRSRVLLTDAQDRSSLAGCRSLHRAGYGVDALASSRPAAAHWSRFCDRRLVATDPREDQGRFVEELRNIVRSTSYRLLVTGSDASLLAISRHRERFAPFVELGLPPADVVERCVSKQALAGRRPMPASAHRRPRCAPTRVRRGRRRVGSDIRSC